jgi:FkbM family methyltransferase
MPSVLKSIARKVLRAYLTHTPVKKGRYPLMMLVHGWASEPVTVEVETKDRGRMLLELDDLMQYPVYYNLFEAKYDLVVKTLLRGMDVTLDVGGNIGQYALLFAQHSNRVYTFEPMPKMIDRLKHHIAINHLEQKLMLIPKALSNKHESLKFELPNAANSGTASTVLGRIANSAQLIEVEAVRLDDLIAEGQVSGRIDLVKIDIEGAELFALQGMEGVLRGPNKPVLILEMNDEMMGLAGYSADGLQQYLDGFGYGAYEITKRGLHGPEARILSNSENYCFLTEKHLQREDIRALVYP